MLEKETVWHPTWTMGTAHVHREIALVISQEDAFAPAVA